MNAERFKQVEAVFAQALAAEPGARAETLDRLCAGDDALRRDAESLLAAHDAAGRFLSEPHAQDAAHDDADPAPDPAIGRRFGAYESIGRIGSGGMGAVYLARRRDDQFDKLVAVKVIHWWLDADEVLRRFERERRVLARLQHPNIATLLDAGVTEDGAPYIVMEHVDGRPIDRHCDDQSLGVDDRLALFLDACDAVTAAHRSLIVHLDLKPANILVTAEGRVKLVDFGIARMIEPDDSGAGAPSDRAALSTITGAGRRAFTPAYAAPEQITGEALTTATDVYALGVVLYELLTGERPFRDDPRSPKTIEQFIRDTPPAPPSVVVASSTSSPSAGAHRDTRLLRRRLAGDLDNIALMAMRKEPHRRYPSVDAFADDLRRHLARRTVVARPDTISYRASRFLRRNRLPVAAAALVFLALVAGIVAVSAQARETAAQRDRAERRFDDLRSLTNSLIAQVDADLGSLPGATEARRAIVTQTTRHLDSLAAEAGDEPELLAELASSYTQLGRLQRSAHGADLGDTAAAVESHAKALALREKVLAAHPLDPGARRAVAESHLLIGDAHRAQGDLDGAVDHYRHSEQHHAVTRDLAPDELLNRLHHRAVILTKIGIIENMRGRHAAAGEAFLDSLELNRAIYAQDPRLTVTRRNIAVGLEKLGDTVEAQGDAAGALARYRESLAIFQDLAEADPADAAHVFTVAIARSKIGEVLGHPSYSNLGDVDGALAQYQEGRRLIGGLLKLDPADARARAVAAFFDRRLGTLLSLKGEHEEALRHHHAALDAAERLARDNPTDVRALSDAASCSLTIAETLAHLGRDDESLEWCMRAAHANEQLLSLNPELAVARLGLAAAWRAAGERCADLADRAPTPADAARRLAESRAWLQNAVDAYTTLESQGALRSAAISDLADARERLAEITATLAAGSLAE